MSILRSESLAKLTEALAAVQAEMTPAKHNQTNPFFKSKYADLAAIWEVCKPLNAHGLAISQLSTITDTGSLVLTTLLLHSSGEWLASEYPVTPTKANDPQALGSALTYARRYALAAIMCVAVEGDDDDGEAATARTSRGQTQSQKATPPVARDQTAPRKDTPVRTSPPSTTIPTPSEATRPASASVGGTFSTKGEVMAWYRENRGLYSLQISAHFPKGRSLQDMTIAELVTAAEAASQPTKESGEEELAF